MLAVSSKVNARTFGANKRSPARLRPVCVATPTASSNGATNQYKFPIRLKTDENCRLSIGLFGFSYNALGGDVVGVAEVKSPEDPVLNVRFERMQIPPLDSRTGAISMPITNRNILPVPPVFTVSIEPRQLAGTLDTSTGKMYLDFISEFFFEISVPFVMDGAALYRAPPIYIRTLLTTETIQSAGLLQYTRTTGTRWSAEDGQVHLVGRAEVAKIGDVLLDNILLLPTTCFAEMSGTLSIGQAGAETESSAPLITPEVLSNN